MRGGTLRGLAVTAKQRLADWPEIPTFAELGHPEFTSPVWFSLSGPKGLPASILDRMNAQINTIMNAPAMVELVSPRTITQSGFSASNTSSILVRIAPVC